MKINGSMILKLLEADPGRYILHDRDEGIYRLKKANGDDVALTENGTVYPVHLPGGVIDGLVDANQLVRERAKYRLPAAT
jgi:hypothetical protein